MVSCKMSVKGNTNITTEAMESILNDILLLIGDATNYLKMFVAGATGFCVLKDGPAQQEGYPPLLPLQEPQHPSSLHRLA